MKPAEHLSTILHEMVSTLLALFEIYDAPPALIDHVGEEVEAIYCRHIPVSCVESNGTHGKLALERVLGELEHHNPALIGHNP